jgi:hypothetical protein
MRATELPSAFITGRHRIRRARSRTAASCRPRTSRVGVVPGLGALRHVAAVGVHDVDVPVTVARAVTGKSSRRPGTTLD